MIARQWQAMASPVEWLIDSPTEPPWVEDLAEQLKNLFAAVEGHLSRFREDSEAVRLNRRLGDPVVVSSVLYHALRLSYRAWQVTEGLFDPRVIVDLQRLGYQGATFGTAQTSNDRWLYRCPRTSTVQLTAPVDFGGIGKSLAVLMASRLVVRAQPEPRPPMLINAGGDLQIIGPALPEGGWQIGIEHPTVPDQLGAVVAVSSPIGLCTSSIRRHQWIRDGRRVHHLIHPITHAPGGEGLLSVTVMHRFPTWAEIWSKVLFLHGPDGIAAAALRHRLTAWWFSDDGRLHATPNASSPLRWIHPDFC